MKYPPALFNDNDLFIQNIPYKKILSVKLKKNNIFFAILENMAMGTSE